MKAHQLQFVSHLDEEDLYRRAREGYQYQIDKNPHLVEELTVPLSSIVLVERHIQVTFPKSLGPTVEVRMDIETASTEVIGYYAMLFEEDFSLQDDFFVIN